MNFNDLTPAQLERTTASGLNRFDSSRATGEVATEVARRAEALGPTYHLFYEEPLRVQRGEGAYLYDVEGREYLDMYNNIPGVGHSNPRVAEAVYRQMLEVTTHTRYMHPAIVDYAERLLSTFPDSVNHVMLTCTGSEANDLAVRIAQHKNGKRGMIVTDFAYHGSTGISAAISPSITGSVAEGDSWVRTVRAPDPYREGPAAAERFLQEVARAIGELEADGTGFAGFVADMVLSTDGVIPDPTPYFAPVAALVKQAGGAFIADEVQSGFARLGDTMWGFQRHFLEPDMITMGKPMGNGYPVAGLAVSRELLAEFGRDVTYFNTFGGNPAAVAAAGAVLDEIVDRELQANAKRLGGILLEGLRDVQAEDETIGDVRGAGLFVAVEYVSDQDTKTPLPSRAAQIVRDLRSAGVLISSTGAYANSLKIRPPLVIDNAGIERFLETFAAVSRKK
jgi:4-aminobutyrate aminotransferase-like enzyme